MKLSIRSLLIAIALVAIAIAAILSGGLAATVFHFVVGTFVIVATITAFVAVRRPRALAMGFAIPSSLYCLLLFAAGGNEFDPHNGSLPTTQLARRGYEAIYRPIYTDMMTGKIVLNYRPNVTNAGGGGMPTVAMTGEFPNRSVYMTTVHGCFLLIAGIFGALYAGVLYESQHRSNTDG